MGDEREQQIRESVRTGYFAGSSPPPSPLTDLAYLLDALAAVREENERIREALDAANAWLKYDIEDLGRPEDLAALREEVHAYFEAPFDDDIAAQYPLMAALAREGGDGK